VTPAKGMTVGKLCEAPSSLRYPERIPYCDRDVSAELKYQIIDNYDHSFGYSIRSMPREQFKIDHYIPLCVGGSNDISNLWPQHESVYSVTDPLEVLLCEKMARGQLLQKDAVQIIIAAKNNLSEVPLILAQIKSLK
jgi:hypothetical protein